MRFSKYSKLAKEKAHPKRSSGIYKEKNLRIKLDIEKMYTLAHTHTHNLRILSLKQKDTLLLPNQQRKRENSISATERKE